MSEDASPILKVCGPRTYRYYPVQALPVLMPNFSQENIDKIGDDADELEAIAVNLDSAPFEELESKLEDDSKVDVPETGLVSYNPKTQSYVSSLKSSRRSEFNKLLGRPELRRPLEDANDCSLGVNMKTCEVSVTGNCPEAVVNLHFSLASKLLDNAFQTYRVVNSTDQSLIAELKAQASTGKLVVKAEKNGFVAKIPHFPRECANFLLADRAVRLRQLKTSLGGNVDYFVNKKTQELEIWGKNADQVRAAFQAFYAKLEEDPRAKASFQGF
jgi:hypothetical protein